MIPMISVLLPASTACAPVAASELTGRWESSATTRGGIASVLEFRTDGTYLRSLTVIVDSRYVADGDMLRNPGTGEADSGSPVRFRIENDRLIRNGMRGEERAERVGRPEPGAPPIVGAWRYRHYTGGTAFERYTTDGRMLFRLPMPGTTKGCYRLDAEASKLTISAGGQDHQTAIQVAGDELQFMDGDHARPYHRSEFGPWYEIEKVEYVEPDHHP
ncbi:MAG TPA: hypothetical protein VEL28_16430 [Candidatus Binatia bacterium]|nr:hypothetical protein [Candidatus Binatia bacterium]